MCRLNSFPGEELIQALCITVPFIRFKVVATTTGYSYRQLRKTSRMGLSYLHISHWYASYTNTSSGSEFSNRGLFTEFATEHSTLTTTIILPPKQQ